MEVEKNCVTSVSIGFTIPGCESNSLVSHLGTRKVRLTGDALSLSNDGLTIRGVFHRDGNASGTFEMQTMFCDGKTNGTWTARYEARPAPAPEPSTPSELLAVIPTMSLPEGVCDRRAGRSRVSEFEEVTARKGDWLLVRSFNYFIPLPVGWTTEETGQMVLINFDPDSTSDVWPLAMQIIPYELGDSTSMGEVLAQADSAAKSEGSYTIVIEAVVDSSKAYILFTRKFEKIGPRTMLMFLSRVLDHPGFVYFWQAGVATAVWDQYFPVVQAMIGGWVDNDLRHLGAHLPEHLGK